MQVDLKDNISTNESVEKKSSGASSDHEDLDILKSIGDDISKARSLRSALKNFRKELRRNHASQKKAVFVKRAKDHNSHFEEKVPPSTIVRRKRKQHVKNRKIQPKTSIFFTPNGHKPRKRPKPTMRIRNIPGFFKHAKLQFNRLASIERTTRQKLDEIHHQIAQYRAEVVELWENANFRIGVLRKYLRQLSSFADDLSRLGRLKTEQADEVLSSHTLFESQRRELMDEMTDPQWTVPHCFYLFAVDHFMGVQQEHLLELAEAMPGNLALAAVANHSIRQHRRAFQRWEELTVERSLLKETLKLITHKREICKAHLKDYKKMLIVMKNKMSRSEREKIRVAEKKMSVGQPLIVSAINKSKPMMSPRIRSVDFRRDLLRATGVVEKSNKDVQITWQSANVKEYVLHVEMFLKEAHSNDFVHSTSLRKLDLNARTRSLFTMPMPSTNPATGSPRIGSPCASPRNGSIRSTLEEKYNSEPTNLLPSPIPLPTTDLINPPRLVLPPTESDASEADYKRSICSEDKDEKSREDEKETSEPLYNQDWSILADILKNISNAHEDHKAVFSQLTNIVEGREELKMEVSTLKENWKSILRLNSVSSSPPDLSSFPDENEEMDNPPKPVDYINDEAKACSQHGEDKTRA